MGTLRVTGADVQDPSPVLGRLADMVQPVYGCEDPTGYSDAAVDGTSGLSNVLLVAGGSTDVLPTSGRSDGVTFAAVFTGFGPAAGISLRRTGALWYDTYEDIIETYIYYKRENEADQVAMRPHPHEFKLYIDI